MDLLCSRPAWSTERIQGLPRAVTQRNSALKETKHRLGRKAFGKRTGKSFEYFHTVGLVTS